MVRTKKALKPSRQTVSFVRNNLGILVAVGLIAAAVDFLLGLGSQPGANTGQSLWVAISFTVFIWTVHRLSNSKLARFNIRNAYYDGSAAFIKQMLVMMFWTVCMLPLLLGSVIFAEVAGPIFAASRAEVLGAFMIWMGLSVISFILILRTIFAPVLVLDETPWVAIKKSWQLTKRRTLFLGIRMLGWFGAVLLPIAIIYYLTLGGVITNPATRQVLQTAADAAVFLIVIPFMSVLIYQLYIYETRQKPSRKTKK